jgi:hypothetical protein
MVVKPLLSFLCCLACFLLGCGRSGEEVLLLQEGQCWAGKVSLGDPTEKVVRILGKAPKRQEDKGWRYYDYGFAEIMIETANDDVASILLREKWKTASGISVGDPLEKILDTYGSVSYSPPILNYPQRGISFVLAPREVTEPDGSRRPRWVAIWARIFKPQA